MSARVAVGSIRHAANAASPAQSGWDEIERGCGWPPLARGQKAFDAVKGANLALAGFADEAQAMGHTPVPLLWAAASASAALTDEAFERLAGVLLDELKAAGPVDAIYLALQGAMAYESAPDGEAELLRRVRAAIGPDVPIVVTVDRRANISPSLASLLQGLLPGRTFDGSDAAETGRRAARLTGRVLTKPAHVVAYPVPAGPRHVAGLFSNDGVPPLTSIGFAAGYPGAPGEQGGPALVASGADPSELSRVLATLAAATTAEASAVTPASTADEAVAKAQRRRGPVILADVCDSPAFGGTADGMTLLKSLLRQGAAGVLGLVCDPHVATTAHRMGEGAEITVCLGAKHGIAGESSLDETFRVERLSDGKVVCEGPLWRGARLDLSPMASLRIGEMRVVVCGKKLDAADRAIFRAVGIDVDAEPLLALKSAVDFRADFLRSDKTVIRVAGPGCVAPDVA
jgi:microcystin degradation protein MlrC